MKKYLKPNIAIEPLFCSWYLWGYLVPPHVAGLFLKNRYLETMKSFLDAPHLHRMASQNSKLAGGQFIDIDNDNLKRIEKIVCDIERNARDLLTLAQDIEFLDAQLQMEADGKSLEPLYQDIPKSLKGCVELVYDHNNHPSIYFFEQILYRRYFNSSLQSIVLSPLEDDQRKFVLSTPRIVSNNELHLPISFDSQIITKICESRGKGLNFEELQETLDLDKNSNEKLKSLFTDKPIISRPDTRFESDGIRIRYFGHACVLLQTKEVSILIDPLISYFRKESEIDRFTLDDLPDRIDYVLFTHNHLDHIVFETLIFLKNKVSNFLLPPSSGGTVIDPDLKLIMRNLGFKNLIQLDYMEEFIFSGGQLFGFPFLGEHGDLNIKSKAAFYINILDRKLLFVADSNNLDNTFYEYLYDIVGAIDSVFIGMESVGGPLDWIYGPLLSKKIKYSHKQSRRYSGSDSKKAFALTRALRAKEVYVYAMGQETWLSHITSLNYQPTSPQILESDLFIENCIKNNIMAKRLYGKGEWNYN